MSIVSVWSGSRDQCGKTASSLALATYMSIEHNMKILLVSTSTNDPTFKDSFWYEKKKKGLEFLGQNPNFISQNGVEGLERIARSNKLTPEIITDYAKIVLKDRLEILLGIEGSEIQYDEVKERYPQILLLADKYYDLVIIDIDPKVGGRIQSEILKNSDVIISMIPQKEKEITDILEKIKKTPYIKKENTLLLIGKYNSKTKYNAKNISRSILKQKTMVNTIPYNSRFFEALQEGKVIDMFLSFLRLKDTTDENYKFISELKRLTEDIKQIIRMAPRKRTM